MPVWVNKSFASDHNYSAENVFRFGQNGRQYAEYSMCLHWIRRVLCKYCVISDWSFVGFGSDIKISSKAYITINISSFVLKLFAEYSKSFYSYFHIPGLSLGEEWERERGKSGIGSGIDYKIDISCIKWVEKSIIRLETKRKLVENQRIIYALNGILRYKVKQIYSLLENFVILCID